MLVPSERSASGRRRYSTDDVERLYRIVALRRLGFALRDIRSMLELRGKSLVEILRRQLDAVGQDLRRREQIRGRLLQLIERLEAADAPSAQTLLTTMEAIAMTIRLDRIHTGTGDTGTTELADGTLVSKTDPRLEAGDLEELAAQLGVAVEAGGLAEDHRRWLERIQNDLFDLGSGVGSDHVRIDYAGWLDEACEEANRELSPIDSYVLPGGSPTAAQLHVCRSVCRRLERWAWGVEGQQEELGRYLNRLSDLLFILSRVAAGDDERLWQPRRG